MWNDVSLVNCWGRSGSLYEWNKYNVFGHLINIEIILSPLIKFKGRWARERNNILNCLMKASDPVCQFSNILPNLTYYLFLNSLKRCKVKGPPSSFANTYILCSICRAGQTKPVGLKSPAQNSSGFPIGDPFCFHKIEFLGIHDTMGSVKDN